MQARESFVHDISSCALTELIGIRIEEGEKKDVESTDLIPTIICICSCASPDGSDFY